MRAVAALVVHPDRRFRTEAGRLTRRASHAVFFAKDADEARELLRAHPSVRVVAAAREAGGSGLIAGLAHERPGLTGFALSAAESRAPAGAELGRRLAAAVASNTLRREHRLGLLLVRRGRRSVAELTERVRAERLARLTGSERPPTGVRS